MECYGTPMSEAAASPESVDSVESTLRDALVNKNTAIGAIVPIVRHLLAGNVNSLFSEEIIARVRGMSEDVARQLLDRLAQAQGETERRDHAPEAVAALIETITANPAFLRYLHAQTVEWQLTRQLQSRLSLDPVLSPLLQALIASPDSALAALAMNFLASQARFCQAQRRMKLPLGELPGDLLHSALLALRTCPGLAPQSDECIAAAGTAVRGEYDESRTRLGLISRLVMGMGGGAVAALSIGHAGAAIFLSALATSSGQDRDITTLSTSKGQTARFALALRAAGLKPEAVREQFLTVHGDLVPPESITRIGSDHAAAMLSSSGAYPGAEYGE